MASSKSHILDSQKVGPHASVTRFSAAERALHWLNAVGVITLIMTGAALYFTPLAKAVGHRGILKEVHIYVGFALAVPFMIAFLPPGNGHLREDMKRFGWFSKADIAWLASFGREGREWVGKFNAGQKLNAVVVGALLLVQYLTGVIMRFDNIFVDDLRTGATFMHDFVFIGLTMLVLGHIVKALTEPKSLKSMFTGSISADWVIHERPMWAKELDLGAECSSGEFDTELADDGSGSS